MQGETSCERGRMAYRGISGQSGRAGKFHMREDIRRRVAKLIAQAESVAGTPEADAFTEKAMAMLTTHGIKEFEAMRA